MSEQNRSKTVALTAKYLAALKPPATGRRIIADTHAPGLIYRLSCTGAGTWALRYRMPGEGRAGVPRLFTIGAAGDVSLANARRRAEQLRADIGNGIDPAAQRRQDMADDRARLTVAACADLWLATRTPIAGMKGRSASNYSNYETALRKYILPAIGALKVSDVQRRHIMTLHASMQETPSGANRMLACASVFFAWCEVEEYRAQHSNPCYGITRYPETARHRFLTHEELLRLGAALARAEFEGLPPSPAMQRKQGGMPKARRAKLGMRPKRGAYRKVADAPPPPVFPADVYHVAALRLMLFTGWRMAEVVSTQWAGVDLTSRVVTHRSTKGGGTARPLSAPAATLLDSLPRVEGSPWVFPRADDRSKPIGKPVRLWDAVRHAAGLDSTDKAERVMPHDLRHSVGAVAASSGASLTVIASLLGHKQVRTTERYAHLSRDARHEAADKVGEIIADALKLGASQDNAHTTADKSVIPIKGVRRAKLRARDR